MIEVILYILRFIIFGVCGFGIFILILVIDLAIYRLFSFEKNIKSNGWWDKNKVGFEIIWLITQIVVGGILGYLWLSLVCGPFILPTILPVEALSLGYVCILLVAGLRVTRNIRLSAITRIKGMTTLDFKE